MVVTLIASLVPFAMLIIKLIYENQKKVGTCVSDNQKMHNAIARGNADGISALFDELRRPAGADNTGGQGSAEIGKRQL